MPNPTTPQDTPALTPTDDPGPVELAALDAIVAAHEPETFLWIIFRRPDGSSAVRYAWTAGGTHLGDHIDQLALTAALDAADHITIGSAHAEHSNRGRIDITAHALRPILADVTAGVRATDDLRESFHRMLTDAAREAGRPQTVDLPPWFGVGPALVTRNSR
ncbi:hypothetical protein [Streptomyces anulatus]|uniref:hypothetical protein n=1 Tax=Streptomyces anulatus TaxID=1892 RepID=UPI0036CFD164